MENRHFDKELSNLNESLLKMGLSVEESIFKCVEALEKRDGNIAKSLIENDSNIDKMELEIDEKCLKLIALYQPMAVDLRFITTGIMIATDLERMGDLSVDIAQRVIDLADKPLPKPLVDLPKMADVIKTMIRKSLEAFVKHNTSIAKEIIVLEDQADDYRDLITDELVQLMVKNSEAIPQALLLILIVRHLERIADHAANIAEDVVYMVDAEVIKHKKRQK